MGNSGVQDGLYLDHGPALRDMGCDLAQGYFLARPQGPERIEKLLDGIRLEGALKPSEKLDLVGAGGVLGVGPASA